MIFELLSAYLPENPVYNNSCRKFILCAGFCQQILECFEKDKILVELY
jgi:hypothetical protein